MTADTERDALVEDLLDAQQDINLAANQHMDQSLCDVSALIDKVEAQIRRDGERIAALEAALHSHVQYADAIADAAEIDMDETRVVIRVMPDGRKVGSKSWAEVQADSRAALAKAGRA